MLMIICKLTFVFDIASLFIYLSTIFTLKIFRPTYNYKLIELIMYYEKSKLRNTKFIVVPDFFLSLHIG